MKKLFIILVILPLLFTWVDVLGQTKQKGEYDMDAYDTVGIRGNFGLPYIFEGKVIGRIGFTHPGWGICTANMIQIYRVYKGNLQPGTIQLITEGGEDHDRRKATVIDDCNNCWVSDSGIYFGSPTKWVPRWSYPEDTVKK